MKSLTLSLTCLCLLLISADARTFTNTEGRRIEAEIVSVSGTQVTLKLAQGATAIFEIAKLSAADQTFVKAWRPPAASSGQRDGPAKGGVYLAVGPGGHRMISKDANTWEKHQEWSPPAHNNDDLNVATFFKGLGIVGGGFSMARIVASRDGETWSDGKLPGGSPIFGFDVLDDVLYATCISGQVYASKDGETWELTGTNADKKPGQGVRWTASGNGLILGVGDFGSVLVISDKGTKVASFTIAGQEKKNANRVAFGNGVFVVSGQKGILARTTDGKEWFNVEPKADGGDFSSIIFDGKEFLASGPDGLVASADGVKWEKRGSGKPGRALRFAHGIAFTWAWPPNKVQISDDSGKTWKPMPNEKGFFVKDVAYGTFSGGAAPKLPGMNGSK